MLFRPYTVSLSTHYCALANKTKSIRITWRSCIQSRSLISWSRVWRHATTHGLDRLTLYSYRPDWMRGTVLHVKLTYWGLRYFWEDLRIINTPTVYINQFLQTEPGYHTPRREMLLWPDVCCFSCMNERLKCMEMLLRIFLYSLEHFIAPETGSISWKLS